MDSSQPVRLDKDENACLPSLNKVSLPLDNTSNVCTIRLESVPIPTTSNSSWKTCLFQAFPHIHICNSLADRQTLYTLSELFKIKFSIKQRTTFVLLFSFQRNHPPFFHTRNYACLSRHIISDCPYLPSPVLSVLYSSHPSDLLTYSFRIFDLPHRVYIFFIHLFGHKLTCRIYCHSSLSFVPAYSLISLQSVKEGTGIGTVPFPH